MKTDREEWAEAPKGLAKKVTRHTRRLLTSRANPIEPPEESADRFLGAWDDTFIPEDVPFPILADPTDGPESALPLSWNADEEFVRESHRAISNRAWRTLSGRML